VTQLRQKMLEELQRRNYSHRTAKTYVRIVRELATYFHQPPPPQVSVSLSLLAPRGTTRACAHAGKGGQHFGEGPGASTHRGRSLLTDSARPNDSAGGCCCSSI
jgi:hypothetical protein